MTDKKTKNLEKKFSGRKGLKRKVFIEREKKAHKKNNLIIGGIFVLLFGILFASCLFLDHEKDITTNTEWLRNIPTHY